MENTFYVYGDQGFEAARVAVILLFLFLAKSKRKSKYQPFNSSYVVCILFFKFCFTHKFGFEFIFFLNKKKSKERRHLANFAQMRTIFCVFFPFLHFV